jgi:hypothetical protein
LSQQRRQAFYTDGHDYVLDALGWADVYESWMGYMEDESWEHDLRSRIESCCYLEIEETSTDGGPGSSVVYSGYVTDTARAKDEVTRALREVCRLHADAVALAKESVRTQESMKGLRESLADLEEQEAQASTRRIFLEAEALRPSLTSMDTNCPGGMSDSWMIALFLAHASPEKNPIGFYVNRGRKAAKLYLAEIFGKPWPKYGGFSEKSRVVRQVMQSSRIVESPGHTGLLMALAYLEDGDYRLLEGRRLTTSSIPENPVLQRAFIDELFGRLRGE